MSLEIYRKQIDEIDNNIVRQLEKRALISGMLGKLKKKSGEEIVEADRKEEILEKLKGTSKKIKSDEMENIFTSILDLSKRHEDKKTRKNLKV